jgi:hypothetical protein
MVIGLCYMSLPTSRQLGMPVPGCFRALLLSGQIWLHFDFWSLLLSCHAQATVHLADPVQTGAASQAL